MKKTGRPPLPNRDDVRASRFSVYVSSAERVAITERAAHMGMTPATWLRTAALERRLPSAPPPPVPAVNREQYAELGKLAANLNQLAHAANSQKKGLFGGGVKVDGELLEQVRAELVRLRLALLGAEGGGDDYQE